MEKNWTQTREVSFDDKGANKMDRIAKTVFAPIYPVIAKNAIAATGITRGVCLDLGTGPGMLAIAMAREAPEMKVVAFDFSQNSRRIAMENIAEANLTDRIHTGAGDVHAMPFEDGYANLIVSRGAMFFWEDLNDAFREIYRVLAPGGATYIGGGFGNRRLKEQVIAEMAVVDPEWDCYAKNKTNAGDLDRFDAMFREIGCDHHRVITDETGFWICLKKDA